MGSLRNLTEPNPLEIYSKNLTSNIGLLTDLSYRFLGDTDTGFFSSGPGEIDFVSNGVIVANISGGGIVLDTISLADGTVTAPSLNFINSPTTGIYLPANNAIGFSTDGTQRLQINNSDVTVLTGDFTVAGVTRVGDGALATPAYSFINDTNTGFYSPANNSIGMVCNGTLVNSFSDTATDLGIYVSLNGGFRKTAPTVPYIDTRLQSNVIDANVQTYTPAEVYGGVILRAGQFGNVTDTLPTGADLVNNIGGGVAVIGMTFTFIVLNLDLTYNVIVTSGAGSNDFLDTTQRTIAPSTSTQFRILITNVGVGTESYALIA